VIEQDGLIGPFKKDIRQLTIEFRAKSTKIFYNARKASDRADFRRMNDYSTFCSCKGAEFHVNVFSLFFFASFAPLRETSLVPVYPG